jgi:hypothetical protein
MSIKANLKTVSDHCSIEIGEQTVTIIKEHSLRGRGDKWIVLTTKEAKFICELIRQDEAERWEKQSGQKPSPSR